MKTKRLLLAIALLFVFGFLNAAPGTTILLHFDNTLCTCGTPPSYEVTVVLHQPSTSPYSGNLSFTVNANTNHTETLLFYETDICVDYVIVAYKNHAQECQSVTINVNCYCDQFSQITDQIAPYVDGTQDCHLIDYYDCQDNYYCTYLEHFFRIYE